MKIMGERYVRINGVNIRYIECGAGHPALLIHGFGEFLESWYFNVGSLSRHCRVYAMDLPGHGLSDKPKIDYSLSSLSRFIIEFTDTMGIEQASLIGHSMGGAVALGVAISSPKRVYKLIAADSGGLAKESPLRYKLMALPVIGEIITKPTIKTLVARGIKRAFYDPQLVSEEMIGMSYQFLKMPGAKRVQLSILRGGENSQHSSQAVMLPDMLHMVRSITLIIHGVQDRVIPVEHALSACRLIPKARLQTFDECGHCPHIEKASEFNQAVITFLK